MKKDKNVNNHNINNYDDDILTEYDFSGGIRGKYALRLAEQKGLIKLDPEVAKVFKSSEQVNTILLAIISSLKKENYKSIY